MSDISLKVFFDTQEQPGGNLECLGLYKVVPDQRVWNALIEFFMQKQNLTSMVLEQIELFLKRKGPVTRGTNGFEQVLPDSSMVFDQNINRFSCVHIKTRPGTAFYQLVNFIDSRDGSVMETTVKRAPREGLLRHVFNDFELEKKERQPARRYEFLNHARGFALDPMATVDALRDFQSVLRTGTVSITVKQLVKVMKRVFTSPKVFETEEYFTPYTSLICDEMKKATGDINTDAFQIKVNDDNYVPDERCNLIVGELRQRSWSVHMIIDIRTYSDKEMDQRLTEALTKCNSKKRRWEALEQEKKVAEAKKRKDIDKHERIISSLEEINGRALQKANFENLETELFDLSDRFVVEKKDAIVEAHENIIDHIDNILTRSKEEAELENKENQEEVERLARVSDETGTRLIHSDWEFTRIKRAIQWIKENRQPDGSAAPKDEPPPVVDEPTCVICLESMSEKHYELSPCEHKICKPCIDDDKKNQEETQAESRYLFQRCPLCRKIVTLLKPMFDDSNSDSDVPTHHEVFGESDIDD
jgi:hypothetical protein